MTEARFLNNSNSLTTVLNNFFRINDELMCAKLAGDAVFQELSENVIIIEIDANKVTLARQMPICGVF